jgi:ABC-type nickel/cobalt efflux system permease component RcnA
MVLALRPQAMWSYTARFLGLSLLALVLSRRVIIIALTVAIALGAFHALEPGHGKTPVFATIHVII